MLLSTWEAPFQEFERLDFQSNPVGPASLERRTSQPEHSGSEQKELVERMSLIYHRIEVVRDSVTCKENNVPRQNLRDTGKKRGGINTQSFPVPVHLQVRLLSSGLSPSTGPRAPSASRMSRFAVMSWLPRVASRTCHGRVTVHSLKN